MDEKPVLLSLKEELACRNVGGILVFSCTRCGKTTRIISSAETSVDTVVTVTWFSYCMLLRYQLHPSRQWKNQ